MDQQDALINQQRQTDMFEQTVLQLSMYLQQQQQLSTSQHHYNLSSQRQPAAYTIARQQLSTFTMANQHRSK